MIFSRALFLVALLVLGVLFAITAGLMVALAIVSSLRGDANVNFGGLWMGSLVFGALSGVCLTGKKLLESRWIQ